MTKQKIHTRTSKKGKRFVAGSKKTQPKPKPNPRVMFKFKNMLALKTILKSVNDLVNEAELLISKSGLKLVEMDPANVALIDVRLKPGDKGVITKPLMSTKLPVNVANLYTTLKDHGAKDIVDVYRVKDHIVFERPDLRQQQPLIEIYRKDIRIPDLTPKYSIDVSSNDLHMMIVQALKVADSIKLRSKNNKLEWFAKGDLVQSDGYIPGKSTGIINEEAKYSLEYLKRITRLYKVFPNAKLKFHKDYPIDITMSGPIGSFNMILAPRVDYD